MVRAFKEAPRGYELPRRTKIANIWSFIVLDDCEDSKKGLHDKVMVVSEGEAIFITSIDCFR
jgi:hypothetical protein